MDGAGIKWALKQAMKYAAGSLPAPPQHGSRILTYHSVGTRDHEMNVTPEDFAAQMRWLAGHGTVAPLADAVSVPGCGVAITFDDGYRDNVLHAAPVLAELGLPATFFLVAGRLGGWLDHDAGRSGAELMTWDEAAQLRDMGAFELGCHTLGHRRLSTLTETEQRDEICTSHEMLERRLGAVTSFAYPFGSALDYTAATVALVRDAGFARAVSNRFGVHVPGADPFTCRRIWIDRTDDLHMFQAKVMGRLDVLRLLDSQPMIRGRRLLNRLLGQ